MRILNVYCQIVFQWYAKLKVAPPPPFTLNRVSSATLDILCAWSMQCQDVSRKYHRELSILFYIYICIYQHLPHVNPTLVVTLLNSMWKLYFDPSQDETVRPLQYCLTMTILHRWSQLVHVTIRNDALNSILLMSSIFEQMKVQWVVRTLYYNTNDFAWYILVHLLERPKQPT